MKNSTFFVIMMFLAMIYNSTIAQVTGTSFTPVVSSAENPIYFYIESASNGVVVSNNYAADFRGHLIVCPTSAGKLQHKLHSEISNKEYALWQLVEINGKNYLKNKATGLFMIGSHSSSSTTTTNDFSFFLLGNNQYRIKTNDQGSSTVAWKEGLCDRSNSGLLENSITAWYFTVPQSGNPLSDAIVAAKNILMVQTKEGIHPGQYKTSARVSFQNAISAAEQVNGNANSTQVEKDNALTMLLAAKEVYVNSKNKIRVSTETEEVWYFIKGLRGVTPTAVYAENQGVGKQILNKEKASVNAQLWKVVNHPTEGYLIQNRLDNTYIDSDVTGAVNINVITNAPTIGLKIVLSPHSTDLVNSIDYFLVENASGSVTFRLHSGGQNNNWGLMNYTGNAADNCSYQFLEYNLIDFLLSAIEDAKQLYSKSPKGEYPGMYSENAKNTFNSAIDAAELVAKNSSSTLPQLEEALEQLTLAQNSFKASRNQIKLSTNEKIVWYYIANVFNYAKDKVITNQGNTSGTPVIFTEQSLDPNKLWQFVDAGDGKMYIKNKASGLYISAKPGTEGSSETPVAFTATFLGEDAQHTFAAAGQWPLHAQQLNTLLVTYPGGANTASAWKLIELSANDADSKTSITNGSVNQRYTETGIGNKGHNLAYITLTTTGINGSVKLKGFEVEVSSAAVSKLHVYSTGIDNRVDKNKHEHLATITVTNAGVKTITLENPFTLGQGAANICFTADISENATEGETINFKVNKVEYNNDEDKTFVPTVKSIAHPTTVFLKQSIVFAPGDYNSTNYRIPAIVTAADGSLVTLTDKRKFNSVDLPEDIDVVARRSTDGGKTWSEPVTVAIGKGRNQGFGDPVLIKASSGKLVTLFVGGVGLWTSTPSNPIRSYVAISNDNGITWSSPRDITSQLFGTGCSNPVRALWEASFFGSGSGLCTRQGRIMVVAAVKEPGMSGLQNYAVYSDDEGETWHVSERAIQGGDEAKVVELNDGTILMSSRAGGNRLYAKSTDGGVSWGTKQSWSDIWGNACDGDIIRYTSTKDGYNKDRLLHTLPNASNRTNLSMWISYNEGETWPVKKTICPGTSAYSSIAILPDGSIGLYYEADESQPYTMMFVNFSLKWLTDGADDYRVSTSVDNPSADKQIFVYSKDGVIKVKGTDMPFRVFNLNGVELKRDQKLNTGIYVVLVDNKSYKVLVK